MAIIGKKEELADPRLATIADEDTKRWYQKPNLRFCYLILVPCALGVEWTSGFDSSMMNSLQAVESWQECKWEIDVVTRTQLLTRNEYRLWSPHEIRSRTVKRHVLPRRSHGNPFRPVLVSMARPSTDYCSRVHLHDVRCRYPSWCSQ